MNTPLRRVSLAMMIMIVLLLANDTYVQVIKADSYRTNPNNQRVLDDEYSRPRGVIVTADGRTLLASSTATNDRLKYLRVYSNGPMYAPVTGYFSSIYGSVGIEKVENDILNGSDDRLFVRRLSDLITGKDVGGGNVELTVQAKIQAAAYNTMVQDGFSGAAVAIKPSTGEILAMVNTPSYDPNALASHDSKTQSTAMKLSNPTSPASPLINQPVSATYQPGSTFKLVVASAALAAGADPNAKTLPAQSVIQLPGTNTTLSNFHGETCPGSVGGKVSITDAIAHSCNTAFATLAAQLGPGAIAAQAAKYGFGTSTTIPINVVSSCLGPRAAGNCMNIQGGTPAVYQSGIGQRDVQETPIQNAMIAATIANGGREMQPQLVEALLAPDLSTIQGFTPQVKTDSVISPDVANSLKAAMLLSENNSGKLNKQANIQIASKTGTAEHGNDPKHTQPYGWYVAFAPADNPQIAVAVVVTAGGNYDAATIGALVAAPVGRAMINAAVGGG
ncbi:MAG TPA: penicillin-binding transpeptidase domain-containing protein [Pseudonocardiaceae bacterium]|nr:penicillin-binding transpeptidase domain-containing protein [Pseudonocardiaceae bacterium]